MNRNLRPGKAGSLLLAFLVAGGCSWNARAGDQDLPEMHKNLSRTVDLQTGVVLGDLEKTQRAASWVLTHDAPRPYSSEAEPYEREMMAYASRIAEAPDLRTAAAQTGMFAATCGTCHQALSRGPKFMVGNVAPGGESQEAMMVRHLWAADRMWEGLIGPSDESWLAGAEAMAETQPEMVRVFRAATGSPASESLLAEVNALAKEALNATGQEERGEVYGRMLGTCNRCHAPIGILVQK
jgi:cytochrome c553